MSYQDDENTVFPTRTGAAIGSAAERQMLDNTQGPSTISKRIRKNLDGSTTRLTTRAGNPEFVTEHDVEDDVDVCPLTDYGFVNSTFNINDVYSYPEDLSRPIYNLFGADGLIKEAKRARNSIKRKRSLMLQGAALFSGLMRRVVQVENGKKKGAQTGEYPPIEEGESPFSPGWSTTDGLFLGATNSGAPTRFVIRIDAEGIWRVPVVFCKKLPSDWVEKEAEWKASLTPDQFHKKVSPYWTVVKFSLNKKVKIAPAPSCFTDGFSPFYEWCGWAFDYTGSRATVVCTGFKNSSDTWLTNRMYEITILSENGVPYYATESISAEDKFVNIWNDGTPGAYTAGLEAASILPGWLETYQFHDAIQYPASAPDQDAPVFSYYEKSGNKIVVRFFYKGGTSGTVTQYHQTGSPRAYIPSGIFKRTYFDTTKGKAVAVDVDPYPVPSNDTSTVIYNFGPYSTTTSGTRAGKDLSFYSEHVGKTEDTYSYSVTKVDLDDAGYGERQDASDGGRFVGDSTWCCVSNMTMYLDVGGYSCPAPIGSSWDDAVRWNNSYRDITYVWQVSSSYSESQSDKTVLILHGFDRESYAVARRLSKTVGEKIIQRSTNGPVGACSVSPKGPMLLDFGNSVVEWTGLGVNFGGYDPAYPRIVVGAMLGENVIGKVVVKSTSLNVDGGVTTLGPSTTKITTITTRVGETTYTDNVLNTDVFRVFSGGDTFMFRACAAAWDMTRKVRQKEIGNSLITENIGGCTPSANITTFVGVF